MAIAKVILNGDTLMDATGNTVTSSTLISGATATKNDGTTVTGNIPQKSAANLTFDSSTGVVSAPWGYYESAASYQVPLRSGSDLYQSGAVVYTPSGYYSSETPYNISTTSHLNPTIQFYSSTGLISATHDGYDAVMNDKIIHGSAYTYSSYQLPTLSATTYTPSTISQTIASYQWLTGTQTIEAIPSAYIIPSGTSNITTNGVYDIGSYASVDVNVAGGGGSSDAEDAIIQRTISGTYENSRVSQIGSYAFTNCGSLITVNFPNVTTIGSSAFYNCYSLTTVSFPNVTMISSYAFYYCSRLTTANFPSATSIGGSAFRSCYNLTTASFPNVTMVTGFMFTSCSSLTTVSFPNATTIGGSAFSGCGSLTTVSFPSVISIWSNAFYYCSRLTTISFPNVTSIGGSAFAYCYSLATASFPSATTIGSGAFSHCSSLTTANFPNVTTIDNSAFTSCGSLITTSFPSVTSIGAYVFDYCHNLTIVNFPKVTTVGNNAFRSCYNLVSVFFLASSVASLGTSVFFSTPIDGYTSSTGGVYGSIFVPASLYNSYIIATNWSTYSARIVGMSWNQLTSENCTMVSATMDGTNYYLGATLAYNTTVISAPTIKVTFKGQEYICSQYSGTMNGYTTYAYGADSDIPTLTPQFDNSHPFLLWCQTRNNINLNNIVIDSNVVEEGEIVPIVIEEQVNSLP